MFVVWCTKKQKCEVIYTYSGLISLNLRLHPRIIYTCLCSCYTWNHQGNQKHPIQHEMWGIRWRALWEHWCHKSASSSLVQRHLPLLVTAKKCKLKPQWDIHSVEWHDKSMPNWMVLRIWSNYSSHKLTLKITNIEKFGGSCLWS